jgi:uncharacterized membrane protein (UPF0136 family)
VESLSYKAQGPSTNLFKQSIESAVPEFRQYGSHGNLPPDHAFYTNDVTPIIKVCDNLSASGEINQTPENFTLRGNHVAHSDRKMPTSMMVILGYAALLVAGGIVGWRVSGSRASLTSSLISAAMLSVAFRIAQLNPAAGYLVAALVALMLSIFFFTRFRKTGKFMPSGMMMAVSATVTLYFLWNALRTW